ncbi:uncharacterized protein PV07_10562 [Cladophialophora immunda]|uniref:Uncharacterized protein n=1 Tax=Cladophialophora immunda TaxID=569365 RepID=A0A0D2C322_9EURO|nr:uncharacterized protein PV07_10562 [Cladophialophora immunda]KIW24875.1 hypothetical protein PV07_10562 [Cladophialophora immunda]
MEGITSRQPPSTQDSVLLQSIRQLRREGNVVTVIWTPVYDENKLKKIAKVKAQKATGPEARPQTQRPGMKSTMLNGARSKCDTTRNLLEKVGKIQENRHSATRQAYKAAIRGTFME